MAEDMARIERKVDEIGRKLDKHIVESEAVRAKVDRHEVLLSNGWAKDLTDSINDLKLKVARIEEKLLAKGSAWKDLSFGIGLVSLIIGTVLNTVKLLSL